MRFGKISHTYLILKDWYEDGALYHKIGCLIAVEEMRLSEIYGLWLAVTKSEFVSPLDVEIKKSLKFNKAYNSALLRFFCCIGMRQNGNISLSVRF